MKVPADVARFVPNAPAFTDGHFTLRLRFDATAHELIEAVAIVPGVYRLENTPLLAEHQPVYAGDTIEAEPWDDDTHLFVRVVERATMRHCWRLVPPAFAGSPEYTAFARSVEAAGGRCAGVLGGRLLVHLPVDSSLEGELGWS